MPFPRLVLSEVSRGLRREVEELVGLAQVLVVIEREVVIL